MERLSTFFSKIKELTFWQRIFSWGPIRMLSYDALEEFKELQNADKAQKDKINELNRSRDILKLQSENTAEKASDLEKQLIKKESQTDNLNQRLDEMNNVIAKLNSKISKYENTEESRTLEYEKKIVQLNQVKESLDNKILKIEEDKIRDKEERFEQMRMMWSEHETSIGQSIRKICHNYQIDYLEEVPFRGKPDNAINIAGEIVIFDAKSPASDNLTNFPKYIKQQTESVKKYANLENVKRDIFLVVPTNTIGKIPQLAYNMSDYNVFVITKDALEPVILSLKKIEEYEFTEQLSPEERDNICRIIGKFAHTTKRKIQIDQFFAHQFIELLVKCKDDLPGSVLETVIEFEKADKLNPPIEKRSKQILTKNLMEKHQSINAEAQIREIDIPMKFDDIKKLD